MAPKKGKAAGPAPKKAEDPKKEAAPVVEQKKEPAPVAEKAKEPEESKKRKAEPMDTDTKKTQKVEEPNPVPKSDTKGVEETEAEGGAEADNGEKEKDAQLDKRTKLTGTVGFEPSDTSLNVVPTLKGKVLMSVSDGGMQYFIGGARANVGMKAGRYMFEVKVVEALLLAEDGHSGQQRAQAPRPKQTVRVGFSTADAPLVLGDHKESVFFDAEGVFHAAKERHPISKRFGREQVVAVLLNLDAKSPNANTISLFIDGARATEPQKLPDNMTDTSLFPHIAFRNVSVHTNFGPEPLKALPFKCTMLQTAAQPDVNAARPAAPKGGKYEVVLPVAFPDQGTFDWVDDFLEKNPKYVELSDRKILDWAQESGLQRPSWQKGSNDKPVFSFGLPGMDDSSVRKVIYSIAPLVPRNYLIMEVKSNLLEADRKEALRRFGAPCYKKVAHVVMGEPNEEWKKRAKEALLKQKQEAANAEFEQRKQEKERKKQQARLQKQREKEARKMEKKRQQAIAAAKNFMIEKAKDQARQAAKKADEAEEDGVEMNEDGSEKVKAADIGKVEKPEAVEKPEGEEEDDEEEDKDDEMEEEGVEEEEAPKVELTKEEENLWFLPKPNKDLTDAVLNHSFGKFTIPDESEGFDDIQFAWQTGPNSKEYLKKWVLERKLTSRIEDLQPSQWFKDEHANWQKVAREWMQKQSEFKAAQKDSDKKEDDDEDRDVDMEELDIFAVEDVCNIGNDVPLFEKFTFEDWAMMQLRFELHLLVNAFKKDVDDEDRPGIHEDHFDFYFNKYFNKHLNPKAYGVDSFPELIELVKDTVAINESNKVLAAQVSVGAGAEAFSIFVKQTEENRRERQRRIDAGDETARIKFDPVLLQQQTQQKTQQQWQNQNYQQHHQQQQQQHYRGGTGRPQFVPPRISPHNQQWQAAAKAGNQQWPAPRSGAGQQSTGRPWRPPAHEPYAQKNQQWGR